MSSIVKIIQVLTVGAGSNSAKAIFEVQTNDSTPKRILLSRNSANDPQVYHMDHADINAIGIFPTEVVAMYENTWPVGLVPPTEGRPTQPTQRPRFAWWLWGS